MFFSFLLLDNLITKKNEDDIQDKCHYNNTESTADGMCVCLPGYVSDPNDITLGCWKCDDKCHKLATCIYPGKCQCKDGLNGTGITCYSPIPLQFSRTALNPLEKGGYHLAIDHTCPEFYKVPMVYLQVGSQIFKAVAFSNDKASFNIPASIQGLKNVTISYDRVNWANDVKLWYFEKPEDNLFIAESTPFVFGLVIVVLIGTCLLHGKQIIFEKEESSQTTESILPSPGRISRND